MNFTVHEISHRIVDETVTSNRVFSRKSGGDDAEIKVAATVAGPGVAGMAMRIIFDIKLQRRQRSQALMERGDGFGVRAPVGKTFLKGLTLTLA